MNKIRVLVVEDEIVVSEDLQARLRKLDYEIAGAADTAADAISLARSTHPDVALMDIMLHGRPEGIEAAEHLKTQLDIPVVYLTAHSDAATLQRAKLTDPAGFIVKPFAEHQLRAALELAPYRHGVERKLRVLSGWLQATLTSIGDAVIATNVKGDVLLLNPAAEELTGWPRDEAIGKPCSQVLRLIDAKTRAPLEDPATAAMRYGIVIRVGGDTLLVRHDDSERYIDDSAAPIMDGAGEVLGAVVVFVDGAGRAAARDRLAQLTRQVEELLSEKQAQESRGSEIEAFAAAVSHDLRQPLNAVMAFSDLLARSYASSLDASGQRFLLRVRQSARHMNTMLSDYLDFLRASRNTPVRGGWIDMEEVTRKVYADLSGLPEQKPSQLVCAKLPPAWGDAGMVQQVIANLLGNAVKYSSRKDTPVVEVGAMDGADYQTYFVRDNGIGFDADRAENLFEPFQRLANVADFPGSGVGLALVKRILARHGGRIWAEGQRDAGATFYFTLPAQPGAEALVAQD